MKGCFVRMGAASWAFSVPCRTERTETAIGGIEKRVEYMSQFSELF